MAVPLLVVLATLVVAQWAALTVLLLRVRRLRRLPDTFRCRARDPRALARGSGLGRFSRLGWASWVHGVLLVRIGRLGRIDVLPVRFPEGSVTSTSADEAKGLGPAPVSVLLRLDDDRLVEVAAPHEARDLVAGPFLAACVRTRDR